VNLDQWLAYQQTLHPRGIDLGLDRLREVAQRLDISRPAPRVLTVGGTNGKGSTVAMLEAMLAAAGLRVGTYTSPHLLRYHERIHLGGREVEDEALLRAFEAVDAARGATGLTYFEFGTLAALWLMQQAALDVAVLEVGLGGRLDAVNLVDADVAVVTTIGLDHQDYLGPDLDRIGGEKAGIARAGRPLVIGDPQPPPGLLRAAEGIGARLLRAGRDFFAEEGEGGEWIYREAAGCSQRLPLPALDAPVQVRNAAAAVAALRALPDLDIPVQAMARGLTRLQLRGRLQRVPGPPDIFLDVAHNPQAAAELAKWLDRHPVAGRNLAVFSALGDKDIGGIVAALGARIACWQLAGLADQPRGLTVEALAARVAEAGAGGELRLHPGVVAALEAARVEARGGDRVLVFGSFHTVAAALAALSPTGA
jgi:dihydrofolate synthase / folylpolyglutamate synthase